MNLASSKVLIIISVFVILCSASILYAQAEPNEQDIQPPTEEQMQQLRAGYKEFQQAARNLLNVVEQAELEEPLLGEIEKAFKDNEEFRHRGLAKERQRYWQYLKDSEDPNETKKVFEDCRIAFGARELANALEDPNRERVLKLPMLTHFRILMDKSDQRKSFLDAIHTPQLTFFDINEPNDEVLWQNFKQFCFESAEGYKTRQRELLEEEKVPEWLAEYAGKMNFAEGAFEMYENGLVMLTPEEVRQAEILLLNTERNLNKIYPEWFNMRHLLTDQANPQDEAIVQEAVEHLRTWPVERTISPSELVD